MSEFFNSFFVTLLSNVSSSQYFTSNSIGNFITRLHKKINLQGEWEVALFEISYTKSWYNIKEDFEIKIIDSDGKQVQTSNLSEGAYSDESTLVNRINYVLKKMGENEAVQFSPPFVSRNIHTNVATILPGKTSEGKFLYPIFGAQLTLLLGIFDIKEYFETNVQIFRDGKKIKGLTPIDLGLINSPIFVYCDLLYPAFIGDTSAKILRIVENKHTAVFGEQVYIHYQNLQYVPLLVKEFETVEIDLKDEYNKTLPFKFGRTIVTLHFRKINKQ